MLKFPSSRSSRPIVLVLFAIGIVLLALGGAFAPLTRVALGTVVNAQTWLALRFRAVQNFLATPNDVASLLKRNADLEAEVARLQAEVVALQQQVSETEVLNTLLGFVQDHPENEYVSAAVIGRDPSPFLHYVIINRGADAGLLPGMPVVMQDGLVGRIDAVDAVAARVQLVTDTASRVNIRLQQSKTEAVLTGSVTGELKLEMVPQEARVPVGDVIVTSGLGGEYPPNLIVGQVVNLRKQDFDIFQTAAVQSSVDFPGLTYVLVITNFRPVDVELLIPTPIAP
ncbi:MAG: rod shape-determining protein MreC [Chloroflexota bacterium]